MENWLIPVQSYTKNVITIQGSVDLPVTDDALKVKEARVFLCIRSQEWPVNEKISIWRDFEFLKIRTIL